MCIVQVLGGCARIVVAEIWAHFGDEHPEHSKHWPSETRCTGHQTTLCMKPHTQTHAEMPHSKKKKGVSKGFLVVQAFCTFTTRPLQLFLLLNNCFVHLAHAVFRFENETTIVPF